MTIEPGDAGILPGPGALIDWSAYGTCRLCKAPPGVACTSVYGRIVSGRPVDGATPLPVAHGHRKRLSGR
jgi:hypothetical protein